MDETCRVMERREMNTEVWWGNAKEEDHLIDLDFEKKIILKRVLKK